VAQFTEHSDSVSDNGDGKLAAGTLMPREQDLTTFTTVNAPLPTTMWQEPAASGVSMTKMLHSFRRRWLLAVFMGLLLGIPAAIATWVIFPKQFEVEAMLQFQDVNLGADGPWDPSWVKRWRETQLQLIRSPFMLQAAIRDPKVANLSLIKNEKEPIYFLQRSLEVATPKDSDLIIIRMEGEEPRDMVEIVKALTAKYIDHAKQEARTKYAEGISILEKQESRTKTELDGKLKAYTELGRKLGGDSREVAGKMEMLRVEMTNLKSEIAELKRAKRQTEEEVERLRAKLDAIERGEFPDALLMDDINNHPRMIRLQEKIAEREEMYDHQRSVAKNPNDLSVIRARNALATLKESEAQLMADLKEQALAKRKYGEGDRPEESLPVMIKRVDTYGSEITRLEEQEKQIKKDFQSMSIDSAELAQLKVDIKNLEQQSADFNRRLSEAYTKLSLPDPVEVVRQADLPEGSTLTYRIILTTFLGLVCFGLGVGGVVLWEYTKQRVSTLNEIGYGGLNLRVLGTVPNLARLSHTQKAGSNGSVSGILAESIDSVRTMLLSNRRADAPKVILVTSADEHEGKTTLATHLAASLARAGRRTLLIDGDLRKPSIHMLFDMPQQAGLCEVLRGESEIDAVVHPAQVEGMWVMLAGQCDHRAVVSLAKENAEAIFRSVRADYDFVVVDTGPVLAFADTLLMGSHADAAVLAILRDVSQIPKVYEARERLEAIGVPVLGGVVGGVSPAANRAYALLN
jgi:capsular exopolysaccharide synthesis family protein